MRWVKFSEKCVSNLTSALCLLTSQQEQIKNRIVGLLLLLVFFCLLFCCKCNGTVHYYFLAYRQLFSFFGPVIVLHSKVLMGIIVIFLIAYLIEWLPYSCEIALKEQETAHQKMHPQVRDLYKRFIFAGRDYPAGLEAVRKQVKKAFFANKDIEDELSFKRAIAKGRYHSRELVAINQLHKYRQIKQRYYDEKPIWRLRSQMVLERINNKSATYCQLANPFFCVIFVHIILHSASSCLVYYGIVKFQCL